MSFAGLKFATEPSSEPITVADVRAQTRNDYTEEDSLIGGGFIRAAREYVEQATRRAMMPQQLRFSMRTWPGRDYTNGLQAYTTLAQYYRWNYFQLPKPPLVGVDSITYLDTSGVTTPMVEGPDFIVDAESEPGRVYLPFGQVWPTAILQMGAPIIVTYRAGYPAFSGVMTTTGSTGTWLSGDKFVPALQGTRVNVNGKSSGVLSVVDDQHLTFVSPADENASPGVPYTANAIPMRYRHAMIMLAAHYYSIREAVIVGKTTAISSKAVEMAVDDLLGQPVRMSI